jgi:hypothetical protein
MTQSGLRFQALSSAGGDSAALDAADSEVYEGNFGIGV